MTLIHSIKTRHFCFMLLIAAFASLASAQERHGLLHTVDSLLTHQYWNSDIDSNYIVRPSTKWRVTGRFNVSGAQIKDEGVADGVHFRSQLDADYKSTVSVGLSYLGLSLNLSLNPAQLSGKYQDYEVNLMAYGKRMGFDFAYQYARNFKGWHENDNEARIALPADILSLKTLNFNAYYAFNHRCFSYPAAFTQSYIQKHSAGSFLVALSLQGQIGETTALEAQETKFNMSNIAIGAGYGYNCVPHRNWLLHISALPTFIVWSKAWIDIDGNRTTMPYHFPEVIITGRGAVVRQMGNYFGGMSMVFTYTNVGNPDRLAFHNIKWYHRLFIGYRF